MTDREPLTDEEAMFASLCLVVHPDGLNPQHPDDREIAEGLVERGTLERAGDAYVASRPLREAMRGHAGMN